MSQPLEVMAFRKRLKSAGYADIRICLDVIGNRIRQDFGHSGDDLYLVSAVEPLAGERVWVTLSLTQMYHAFQRQRGGILSRAYPKSGIGVSSDAPSKSGAGIPSRA